MNASAARMAAEISLHRQGDSMYIRWIATVLLTSVLSACSPARQSSLPTLAIPGASMETISPASSQVPSMALQPTPGIGTPVPGWENIPIMPGAYDAELEDMVYLYSVKATMKEVEEYYRTKLDVNGWTLTDRNVMETSSSSGLATVLDFQKDGQSLNVMLVGLETEPATAVILSRLGP